MSLLAQYSIPTGIPSKPFVHVTIESTEYVTVRVMKTLEGLSDSTQTAHVHGVDWASAEADARAFVAESVEAFKERAEPLLAIEALIARLGAVDAG